MSSLRLASHIHSEFSDDSDWSLDRLARLLRRIGYDGALVCDHDRTMSEASWARLVEACADVSSRRFVMVPGVEYQDPGHLVHLPVFGDIPFLGSSPDITTALQSAHAAGGASVLAHPARRDAFRVFSEDWVPYLHGIEVWSRKYDGLAPNTWALAAAERHRLTPFVSLDYHGSRQLYPLAMIVDVVPGPPSNQIEQIIHSIRSGSCRPAAFGLHPGRYARAPLAQVMRGLEHSRRRAAPAIRRGERSLRSKFARVTEVKQENR